jgi:polysaccharide deacetylase family protein (PEP-CTERM system associated)
MNSKKHILLTIDVEDWFQVENFRPWIPFETWDQYELRVEKNTHSLLNLFDSVVLKAQSLKLKAENQIENNYRLSAVRYEKGHPKVTFFMLGWIAERLPHLVREIHSRGHEVASHGYNHNLCSQQSPADLRRELTESKKLLEDITGSQIFGFRAPNFSINEDILKIIEDAGYLYDSSYNSFGFHGRYGRISLNGRRKNGIVHQISDKFFELPISNVHFRYPLSSHKPLVLPWGGGAYFRLIPLSLFSLGLKDILKKESTYLFYIHPWEVDLHQPKIKEISIGFKIRHYLNIGQTQQKLVKLINDFRHCRFTNCCQYVKSLLPDFC